MSEGITSCVTCETKLVNDEIGYCANCNESQELEAEYTYTFDNQKTLQLKSEEQREELIQFLDHPDYKITHLTLGEILPLLNENKIYAIIDPGIASSLSYSIILSVESVEEINNSRIAWLKKYWMEKYELELEEFTYQVGLIFWSQSYHTDDVYKRVYDYPASIISGYVLRELL